MLDRGVDLRFLCRPSDLVHPNEWTMVDALEWDTEDLRWDNPSPPEVPAMRVLASSCPNGNCPTIWDPETGTGDLLVQGHTSTAIGVPAGESMVRVPAEVILAAAAALRSAGAVTP